MSGCSPACNAHDLVTSRKTYAHLLTNRDVIRWTAAVHICPRGFTGASLPARMRALFIQLIPFIGFANVFGSPLAAPVIDLDIGSFRGSSANGTDIFLGIPYAQPPVGRLRFSAPQPIATRTNSVRSAVQFGNACPQPPNPASLGAEIGEDCLFLNVRHSCPDEGPGMKRGFL